MTTFSRADFWSRPDKWPAFDPPGFIFLARAVGEIGAAMFGGEWTGAEPGLDPIPELPLWRSKAVAWQVQRGWRLMGRLQSERRAKMSDAEREEDDRLSLERSGSALGAPRRAAPASLYSSNDFTDEDWADICRLNQHDRAAQAPALGRWAAVQQEVVRGCLEGRLAYALRDDATGQMLSGKPEWWNVDVWHWRFYVCQMNPSEITSSAMAGARFRKIFVTRETLDTFKARLATDGEPPSAVWAPTPGQLLEEWCNQGAPETEARRRAKLVDANPPDTLICKALVRMWEEAGRGLVKWKTIEQYRVGSRTGKR